MPMMSSDDVATVLNIVADLFAASPRHTFTREEIVRTLRALPDKMAQEMLHMELERVMALQYTSQEKPS